MSPQCVIEYDRSKAGPPQSDEILHSLFEHRFIGTALCAAGGNILAISAAFARMLGYRPEELCGTDYAVLTGAKDRVDIAKTLGEIESGEASVQGRERLYVQKSGAPRWCLESFSPVKNSAGRLHGLLVLVQDIQQRKDMEEDRTKRLIHAQKMEAMGTLAGGIAHDFNNLLGVILGFASIVRLRLSPSDPLREFVAIIEQSAERGADLARQLLGLARQEKQETALTKVGDVVGRVVKIITRTFDKRIQVQTRTASGLLYVDANPGRLEQAILNLCINARDAIPDGGVISLETSRLILREGDLMGGGRCPPGEYARITVRDTGIGIPPQLLTRIFDPFFTTKEAGKGSGLGLAMVDGMASNAGGFVDVQSEVGFGSSFSIHLPLKLPPLPRQAANKCSRIEPGAGTVLVVEDEPMVRAFAEEGLKRLGYNVLTAVDGRQACEIFSTHSKQVDMVLLDMVMPGITGMEACRRLRGIDPKVKVILSSGFSSAEIEREALAAGAVSFIDKPYTLEQLSSVLRRTSQSAAPRPQDDSSSKAA